MTSFQKVLTSLIQLLALSSGRDKTCRLVQYFCKYLIGKYNVQYQLLISERNNIKGKIVKSQALMGAMGMTRKVLRFGPSINCVKTMLTNINSLLKGTNSQSAHMVILKTLSAFFIAMFFICDHYLWLYRVKLVQNQKIRGICDYYASFGWLMDCIVTLIKNIVIYTELQNEQKKKQQFALAIDSLRVIFDAPIAWHFMYAGTVSNKVAGTLGTITSLIGIYQLWK